MFLKYRAVRYTLRVSLFVLFVAVGVFSVGHGHFTKKVQAHSVLLENLLSTGGTDKAIREDRAFSESVSFEYPLISFGNAWNSIRNLKKPKMENSTFLDIFVVDNFSVSAHMCYAHVVRGAYFAALEICDKAIEEGEAQGKDVTVLYYNKGVSYVKLRRKKSGAFESAMDNFKPIVHTSVKGRLVLEKLLLLREAMNALKEQDKKGGEEIRKLPPLFDDSKAGKDGSGAPKGY
jgi:hypothetical protein